MSNIKFPFTAHAIKVDQRLGTFYVTALPSDLLLQVSASDSTRAILNSDSVGYHLEGTQRLIQDKRLNEIADYIDRSDSAFPNSIILAANYDYATGLDQDEIEEMESESKGGQGVGQSEQWYVSEDASGCHTLIIPSAARLAAVIDGQHRLFSFAKASQGARDTTTLVCSIYLDLPKALQAQIFAVINSTQKRVDRSLTYELFGYNVSDEAPELWTPDKLAVFLTRKIGTDKESPLSGRILVAPKRDPGLLQIAAKAQWRVSTSVIVDGVMRLFSTNPKRDANTMRKSEPRPRTVLLDGPRDLSPLRSVFIKGNDALIYKLVLNYLVACENVFWKSASVESFIFRTIGIQAVLDILRKISERSIEDRDISAEYFENLLRPAGRIDFAAEKFRNPSGSGRSIIRKELEAAIGLVERT